MTLINTSLRCLALCAALLAPRLMAQDAAVAPERIHIIGASVSGGFVDGPLFGAEEPGDSVSLHRVLKKWCDGEVKVTTHPLMQMWSLFRDPVEIGGQELALAKRRKPDAVVAVDFLFWFAYGYVGRDPERQRRARFEQGLALLDQLEVPLIVGDLPDMRGAATRMLKPQQVPSKKTLARLNARLRGWARQRGDVTVVPLSELIHELKIDGTVLPLAAGALRTAPLALLQADRLHPTRLGVAFLTYRMQPALRRLFPKAHALHGHAWTLEDLVAAARAEEELEELRAAATGRGGR